MWRHPVQKCASVAFDSAGLFILQTGGNHARARCMQQWLQCSIGAVTWPRKGTGVFVACTHKVVELRVEDLEAAPNVRASCVRVVPTPIASPTHIAVPANDSCWFVVDMNRDLYWGTMGSKTEPAEVEPVPLASSRRIVSLYRASRGSPGAVGVVFDDQVRQEYDRHGLVAIKKLSALSSKVARIR
jgi:hypothetical protein